MIVVITTVVITNVLEEYAASIFSMLDTAHYVAVLVNVTIQCHNTEDYSRDFQCYVNLISTLSHGCRALLPSYRPAPDYETAMQQKYRGASQTSANLNMRPNHQIGILYSSQPEIHQTHIQEVSCKI